MANPGLERAYALLKSATRKLNFADGPGCLADLEQLQAASPMLASNTVTMRGQCEMLAGHCQQGKQRIVDAMVDETNAHPDRAKATAESMAAMYCQGGDSSERDRLLGALQELTLGAYSETRTVEQCRTTLATARALLPKVTPQGPEDHQVVGAGKTLYAAAPGCFARAGDCAVAWQTHRELFPQDSLADVKDPKIRADVLNTTFDSLVPRCKGKR